MAVTYQSPVQLDEQTYELTYSSDLGGTPVFRVFQNGVFITETTHTTFEFQVFPGDALLVEVLDDANALPTQVLEGRFTLGWDRVAGAVKYVVEEFVTSIWTLRQEVAEAGKGFYLWRSRYMEDVTVHQFRVTPVDAGGESGTSLQFSGLMVRNPDAPLHTLVFDSGTGLLTIDDPV